MSLISFNVWCIFALQMKTRLDCKQSCIEEKYSTLHYMMEDVIVSNIFIMKTNLL